MSNNLIKYSVSSNFQYQQSYGFNYLLHEK